VREIVGTIAKFNASPHPLLNVERLVGVQMVSLTIGFNIAWGGRGGDVSFTRYWPLT